MTTYVRRAQRRNLGDLAWASKPASPGVGDRAFFTDVGPNGVDMRWNGTMWIPTGNVIVYNTGLPLGIAPSGTMNANGAFVAGASMPVAMTNGGYLYFPAGTLPAGLYYVTQTDATHFTVFNNLYTGGVATVPGAPTAIVGSGPGAAGTTSEITLSSFTIQGTLLGANGSADLRFGASAPTSANTKAFKWRYGASYTPVNVSGLTTTSFIYSQSVMQNKNNAAVQNSFSWFPEGGYTTTATNRGTTASGSDQTMSLTFQLGSATEFVVIDYCRFILYPG